MNEENASDFGGMGQPLAEPNHSVASLGSSGFGSGIVLVRSIAVRVLDSILQDPGGSLIQSS